MNILAIGAHFDDVELGCAGSLAKHVREGDKVYVFVASSSGYTNPQNQSVRSSKTAQMEGRNAMHILNIEKLVEGNLPTLHVEFDDRLNSLITSLVEKFSIDTVYTHWSGDVHHDHRAVSLSSLHSCRHVPRLLMYRSNWYHSCDAFNGTYYVDITETWGTKEAAIREHKSEISRVGESWISFFHTEARNAGQRIGVDLAEVFQVVKYLS